MRRTKDEPTRHVTRADAEAIDVVIVERMIGAGAVDVGARPERESDAWDEYDRQRRIESRIIV